MTRTQRIQNLDLKVGDAIPLLSTTYIVRELVPFEQATIDLFGCDGRYAKSDNNWGMSIPDEGFMEVVR